MKYRVFYNPDCQMYGVQRYTTLTATPTWTQVLPPKKSYGARHGQSAYTNYKGVAERWKQELEQTK